MVIIGIMLFIFLFWLFAVEDSNDLEDDLYTEEELFSPEERRRNFLARLREREEDQSEDSITK